MIGATANCKGLNPLITSLSSLQHLTHLNLYKMNQSHKSALKLLGNACPLLTHLKISGYCISDKDIFSLILGEFADQLFSENEDPNKVWSEDSSLEFLQAPSEILTPFCFTLRHLDLAIHPNDNEANRSVASFVLRHLPLLERLGGDSTSFGVEDFKKLMKKESKTGKIIAKQFENACKEALRVVAFESRSTFSGKFCKIFCITLLESQVDSLNIFFYRKTFTCPFRFCFSLPYA